MARTTRSLQRRSPMIEHAFAPFGAPSAGRVPRAPWSAPLRASCPMTRAAVHPRQEKLRIRALGHTCCPHLGPHFLAHRFAASKTVPQSSSWEVVGIWPRQTNHAPTGTFTTADQRILPCQALVAVILWCHRLAENGQHVVDTPFSKTRCAGCWSDRALGALGRSAAPSLACDPVGP